MQIINRIREALDALEHDANKWRQLNARVMSTKTNPRNQNVAAMFTEIGAGSKSEQHHHCTVEAAINAPAILELVTKADKGPTK